MENLHEIGIALLITFGCIAAFVAWIALWFHIGLANDWGSGAVCFCIFALPLLIGGVILVIL